MKKTSRKTFTLGMVFCINAILLTGCWSYISIEDVNFVAGAAIDAEKEGKIRSTLQYIIPQTGGGGQSMGSTTQQAYINVKETGEALEPIGWETTLKREGSIFGAHEKIVVIGDKLARKTNLEQLVDLYYRDIDIRGSTLVFVSKGKASSTLESKEPNVIPSFRISEIANQQLSTRMIKPTTLIQVLGYMESDSSFVVQRLSSENGDTQLDGAAVFKGKTKKLIGFFTKKEVEGLNLITGDSKSGSIRAKTKQPVYYQIEGLKSKIIPHVKSGQISFQVQVNTDGRIAEDWKTPLNLFENSDLKKVEKDIQQQIEKSISHTLDKMQNDLGVDAGGFGNQLRIQHPRLWESVKKDWDSQFRTVPITTKVEVKISDYGMIGEKKG
ncbi:Ger(x)C family spore germination protein [Fictibacillus barbaricus]|uniref:Ger(X)C family spore germination protein n=1 Tax=Fictibacillus barbaricus TaxID=182136 RepID=A0ABS2ZEI2_9BACL|nr:Ger(x)C family spore germination protein [Fictibacillus barbaricus]MBN3545120.1 Ger(x)C family spore germination protein [Fictibacillus barbaricus]GGB61550.1 germination protein BC [Fictibacillus barbaricus]